MHWFSVISFLISALVLTAIFVRAVYPLFFYFFNKLSYSVYTIKTLAVLGTVFTVGMVGFGIVLTGNNIIPNNKPPTKTDSLSIAQMAFNIPLKMKVGETYEAVFNITKSRDKKILVSRFAKEQYPDKYVFVDSFYVSSIVKVNLVDLDIDSSNFKIDSKGSSKIQNVDYSSTTSWRFRVKPLQGGDNDLLIVITTFVEDTPRDITEREAFRQKITVESNYWYSITDFFKKNWTIIVPLILLPMFIFFLGEWKKKLEDKKEKLEKAENTRLEQEKKDMEAETKRLKEAEIKRIKDKEIKIINEKIEKINEEIKKRGGNFPNPNDNLDTPTN